MDAALSTDAVFWAIAVPAAIWAGVSKGGFGSGADFLAVVALTLVVPPVTALALLMPLLLVMDAITVRGFWGLWQRSSAIALIAGGIPGALLGMALLSWASDDALRLLIAGVALASVAWRVAGEAGMIRVAAAPFRWSTGLAAGVGSGFMSFTTHAGGPILAAFMLAQRVDKTTYQATAAIAFGTINIVKAAGYGALGLFTAETLTVDLWLAIPAALGALLGVRAHYLVPERLFFALTYVLLTGLSLKLIWDVAT